MKTNVAESIRQQVVRAVKMGANPDSNLQAQLDDLKREVLAAHRHVLCQDLDPSEHFPYLRSLFILSKEDCETIEHEVTSSQKTSRFIDILLKKGPRGFDEFCESLRKNKTQLHLLTSLNKALELGRGEILAQAEEVPSKMDSQFKLPTPEEAGLLDTVENVQKAGMYGSGQTANRLKTDPTETGGPY